jgi:hypothetical protein
MRTDGNERLDPLWIVTAHLSDEFAGRFEFGTISFVAAEEIATPKSWPKSGKSPRTAGIE